MGFPIFDYRRDIKNVLVAPEIRSRFMYLPVGGSSAPHTHDLGWEIFLILQGRVRFKIDGETEVLEPGQLCYAAPGQMHEVEVLGDEDMIMYLSVTPHIQPTHTFWSEEGHRLPHRFRPNADYDLETDTAVTLGDALFRQWRSTEALSRTAQAVAEKHRETLPLLQKAIEAGDVDRARELRAQLWDDTVDVFKVTREVADAWNNLVPRIDEI